MSRNYDTMIDNVDVLYGALLERTDDYLRLYGELCDAKFDLNRAIDMAYDSGAVVGKNEREREANLRQILPEEFAKVDRLERETRAAERSRRHAEIEAENIRLKVMLISSSLL